MIVQHPESEISSIRRPVAPSRLIQILIALLALATLVPTTLWAREGFGDVTVSGWLLTAVVLSVGVLGLYLQSTRRRSG